MAWVKFDKKLPKEGQKVNAKYNVYRYGVLSYTEKGRLTYLRMNTVINRPMVSLSEWLDDECYIEALEWFDKIKC